MREEDRVVVVLIIIIIARKKKKNPMHISLMKSNPVHIQEIIINSPVHISQRKHIYLMKYNPTHKSISQNYLIGPSEHLRLNLLVITSQGNKIFRDGSKRETDSSNLQSGIQVPILKILTK